VTIMKRIYNSQMIKRYIEKHGISEFFSKDIKPYMELFLFNRGDHICREGETLDYLFFLVEGKAKVYTSLSNGKSLLVCFYNSGKVIGDIEFMKLETAISNIQAIEESYCITIPVGKIREYLLDDAKFLRFMCESLSQKLNRLSKNSSINLLYPLENRLASYILAMGIWVDHKEGNVLVFNENLTEIARLLGASYRHLLRTVNTLCKKGVIIKKNSSFEVVDHNMLISLAADLYK
jgi:CRP/FNR family putative post-exponential-phase nitrogen-starvation transcriptional regulator